MKWKSPSVAAFEPLMIWIGIDVVVYEYKKGFGFGDVLAYVYPLHITKGCLE